MVMSILSSAIIKSVNVIKVFNMQVFIVGTPFSTAIHLDKKRLNKQIIECHQILDTINGKFINKICNFFIIIFLFQKFVLYLYC